MADTESERDCVYEDEIYGFCKLEYAKNLINILNESHATRHYSLVVEYLDFSLNCPKSSKVLITNPEEIFTAGDKAIRRALLEIYNSWDSPQKLVFKPNVHFRIHSKSFPGRSAFYKHVFPNTKPTTIGRFSALVGTVTRTTIMAPLVYKRAYQCNKCKQVMMYEASASRYHAFPMVLDKCQNLCNGAKVEMVETNSESNSSASVEVKDYQEIKVQEKVSSVDYSVVSRVYWVVLEHDLVNSCKPGDDIVVTGTLSLRVKKTRMNTLWGTETCFKANHVNVVNNHRSDITLNSMIVEGFETFWRQHADNPYLARNIIVKSFCPEIYGMYIIKLALCVVLAGGVTKTKGASKIRGESHLLLVGDPGTGKSQLLKYASKLTPRSVLTNGLGVTSAGLTVSAVKDSGDWHLEAGALVLADNGVCCIDEFSNMKEQDRVSIHEAMEQQSISVAKAGVVCKLSTKCTVLAATNPKLSKYDTDESPEVNIGIPSPLLSRFDLLIVLRDAESDSWDDLLGKFILKGKDVIEAIANNAKLAGTIWSRETLQQYLMLIKGKDPEMTENAEQILGAYYERQRKSEYRDVARTTVRFLESLFRLAEGHARLMFRDQVLVHDAISAISLMEASMQSSALTVVPNVLHISFPENPLEEYYNQAQLILKKLNLPNIWATEKNSLDELLKLHAKDVPNVSERKNMQFPLKTSRSDDDEETKKEETISEWFGRCKDKDSSNISESNDEKIHGNIIVTSTQNSRVPETPRRFRGDNNLDESLSPISCASSRKDLANILTPSQLISPSKILPCEKAVMTKCERFSSESPKRQRELKRKRSNENEIPKQSAESPIELSNPTKRNRFDLSRFKRKED